MEGAWAVEKEEHVDANAGNKIQREMERDKAIKIPGPPETKTTPRRPASQVLPPLPLSGAPRPCLAQIMGPGRTRKYCVVCKLVDALWKKG